MEYVNCNLCGADDTELIYPSTLSRRDVSPTSAQFACTSNAYGIHPPIVRCRQCGLVYANPRPGADEVIDEYTAVADPVYLTERKGRVMTFHRHLDHLGSRIGMNGQRRVLDIGCHVGLFLEAAAARGWDAWGVEPSQWAVAQARERDLQVIQGTLAGSSLPHSHFDLVTLWDVIEHFSDPMSELRRIAGIVRPGGWICTHTMDVGSLFARVMGRRWPWLMEMHLYYFSRVTLAAMLQRAGFRVVDVSARGRVLRLEYVVSRLAPYSAGLVGPISRAIQTLGLAEWLIPVNFGDLFTVYARKEP
ncbi:MAG: methyltransferase domain-containing protein [Anaerolineae bacterium]